MLTGTANCLVLDSDFLNTISTAQFVFQLLDHFSYRRAEVPSVRLDKTYIQSVVFKTYTANAVEGNNTTISVFFSQWI